MAQESTNLPQSAEAVDLSRHRACELRDHNRHGWQKRLQVVWIDQPDDINSLAVSYEANDISGGGMSFYSRMMVHPGQRGIALLGTKGSIPLVRCFEVRHCVYLTEGRVHLIGNCWTSIPKHIHATVTESDRGEVLSIEYVAPGPARSAERKSA